MDWGFRREAAIWVDERPYAPNLYPIGTELRKWLLQQGQLTFFSHTDRKLSNALTNPYSYDASLLALAYSATVNDAVAFIRSGKEEDAVDVEIRAIRYYTELVLYTARICEALIKQLLFCTTFRRRDYKRATLGSLLTVECSGCKNSEEKRHKISLLGSLAHRYKFCGPYEACLHDRLTIVRKRRNNETAHSGIVEFQDLNASESRSRLEEQMDLVGCELIHMLAHISDIETHMMEEMHTYIDEENEKSMLEARKLFVKLQAINRGEFPSAVEETGIHD